MNCVVLSNGRDEASGRKERINAEATETQRARRRGGNGSREPLERPTNRGTRLGECRLVSPGLVFDCELSRSNGGAGPGRPRAFCLAVSSCFKPLRLHPALCAWRGGTRGLLRYCAALHGP